MKIIDGKYHIEGEQIVKTGNGEPVPEDEPLILFRARDTHALATLDYYRDACVAASCTQHQLDAIDAVRVKFLAFRSRNPTRMKEPGSTLGE